MPIRAACSVVQRAERRDVLVELAPHLERAVSIEGGRGPGGRVAIRIDVAVEELTDGEAVPVVERADVALAEHRAADTLQHRLTDAVGIPEVLLPVRQALGPLLGDDVQAVRIQARVQAIERVALVARQTSRGS